MGGRSEAALARRAAKRGRTVEEQAAADELETSKKVAAAPAPTPAAPAPTPAPAAKLTPAIPAPAKPTLAKPAPAEPAPAAASTSEPEAAADDATDGKHRPKQPLPANHLLGSRRNGAKRKKLKELHEAERSGAPPPEPRKELPKPKESTSSGAASSKAPVPADGAKRVRASTKEGLVVWLKDGEQPAPMVIRRSEIREPPEPRASPKFLFLEALGKEGQQAPGRWVHSAEVLPLDARFKELWEAHQADPTPREALRQAVMQQQRVLARLSVQELWSQLLGDGGDEPWPAK